VPAEAAPQAFWGGLFEGISAVLQGSSKRNRADHQTTGLHRLLPESQFRQLGAEFFPVSLSRIARKQRDTDRHHATGNNYQLRPGHAVSPAARHLLGTGLFARALASAPRAIANPWALSRYQRRRGQPCSRFG